jgi:hypothetical protein
VKELSSFTACVTRDMILHAVELDVEGACELYHLAAAAGADFEQPKWEATTRLQQQGPQDVGQNACQQEND